MSDQTIGGSVFHARLRTSSKVLFWLGLAFTVLGIAAIAFPMLSTLLAVFLVGWTFLFYGILMVVGSFSIHGTGPFFGTLLLALLATAAGAFLLINPLSGAVALTIMVGVLFLLQGAVEMVFAFEMRPHRGWTWMLLSAAASIVLGLVIAAGWPGVSVIALGIILGINFLTTGLGYLFVWNSIKG